MKKNKINLTELAVQSFVTTALKAQSKTVQGGLPNITQDGPCRSSWTCNSGCITQ